MSLSYEEYSADEQYLKFCGSKWVFAENIRISVILDETKFFNITNDASDGLMSPLIVRITISSFIKPFRFPILLYYML